jgi:hypothetical protein
MRVMDKTYQNDKGVLLILRCPLCGLFILRVMRDNDNTARRVGHRRSAMVMSSLMFQRLGLRPARAIAVRHGHGHGDHPSCLSRRTMNKGIPREHWSRRRERQRR